MNTINDKQINKNRKYLVSVWEKPESSRINVVTYAYYSYNSVNCDKAMINTIDTLPNITTYEITLNKDEKANLTTFKNCKALKNKKIIAWSLIE